MISSTGKRLLRQTLFSSLRNFQFPDLYLCAASTLAEAEPKSGNTDKFPFGAKYLIENFGFSRQKALISSKGLYIHSPEKPDLVVACLKKHGFSDAQIIRAIRGSPRVLTLNPEGNLLPKIEFFHSLGLSCDETAKVLSSSRGLLARSLDGQIISSFNFLRNLLQSDEDAKDIIKRFSDIYYLDLQLTVPPNFNSLKEAGVPEVKILHFFRKYPRCFMIPPDKFRIFVKHIQDKGVDPTKTAFVFAIHVLKTLSRSTWGKKIELYKKWGYSEEQVLAAFRIFPYIMTISESKMERMMDHFINEMGCDISFLLRSPHIIGLSFEKNVLPRCAVYKILTSKGLIKKSTSLNVLLKCSKQRFLEKFVLCYAKEIPELLNLCPI